ncbi:MAG: hypothetical protein C5B49_02035 [Bdellovibrio sp.]|nr:MAG: hypothetical protein C5B49_02035 [Bdellovibrio sp.]
MPNSVFVPSDIFSVLLTTMGRFIPLQKRNVVYCRIVNRSHVFNFAALPFPEFIINVSWDSTGGKNLESWKE